MRMVIVGAGSMGREVAAWMRLERMPAASLAFVDDIRISPGFVDGIPVIDRVRDFQPLATDGVLVAVSSPVDRERLHQQFAGLTPMMVSFVANRSVVADDVQVLNGSLVYPMSLVSVGAKMGRGVLVGAYSSVGHDVQVGDFTTMSSHVDLCGHAVIGRRVSIGSGARVLPGVRVGDDAVIGAGAVVLRDVPAGTTVFGNPATKVYARD